MGSIISKIYDDYDEYSTLCDILKIEAIPIRNEGKSFYNHAEEVLAALDPVILKELETKYYWISNLK